MFFGVRRVAENTGAPFLRQRVGGLGVFGGLIQTSGSVISVRMLRFDPEDPYPLRLPPDEPAYADAQLHAAEADRWLGLDTERIEDLLVARRVSRSRLTESAISELPLSDTAMKTERLPPPAEQQLWIGLPVQAMLTPYTELRAMLARLAPLPGQTVVDLGAGYGRMGLVIARHHPGVRFVGYEYVAERVKAGGGVIESQQLAAKKRPINPEHLPNHSPTHEPLIQLLQADLALPDFTPILADYYFIYDYGTRAAIEKTLQDLRTLARTRPLTVIGRGRASRDAIERGHPWLSQVREPEHCGHYTIYRT